jgi:two-component system response regulator HydG
MSEKGSVLVVDDKPNMLKMLRTMLGDEYDVRIAENGKEALEKFRDSPADIVLTDIRMPDMNGMEVLRAIKEESSQTEVILMTAFAEVSQAVEAVKEGAYNYVKKPFEPEDMLITLEKALERKRLKERTRVLQEEVEDKYGFPNIVGQSDAMRRVYELAHKAAKTDTTVLITGESGTGKELFAKAIHYASSRAKNRIVAINCGAVPKDLIESELFGHVKGAFSGATKDKQGLFEEANGGTLLLDEISELPLELQVKINRAIQEREIRRVGDTRSRTVDVRLIASTNRDLAEAVREGDFRQDLYYRLNVFPLRLPPLRERDGDIPLLVEHFLEEFAGEEAEEYEVEPDAMQQLLCHDWPGNVRELRNVIERAVVLADDQRITVETLVMGGQPMQTGQEDGNPLTELPYREAMDRMSTNCQSEYLVQVLKKYGGNVTKAAEHAGIERESFHRLMRKCDIKSEEIKRELADE